MDDKSVAELGPGHIGAEAYARNRPPIAGAVST